MKQQNILIGTINRSPRLTYTLDLIFRNLLNTSFTLSQNRKDFDFFDGPKIFYSKHNIKGEHLFIEADDLLFEKGIRKITAFKTVNNIPFLFEKNQTIPSDFFASIFYIVSRMEEYQMNDLDEHGRFKAKDSILFKMNVLQIPIVHIWANYLKGLILEKYPQHKFGERKFNFVPTYDIDMAWAFKHKNTFRKVTSVLKDLYNRDYKNIQYRKAVLKNQLPDPFDNYEFFNKHHKELKPIYFILLGDYGTHDKNLRHQNHEFVKLVKSLSLKNDIGIHPSYASKNNISKIKTEKKRLIEIVNEEVTLSRQHFLKLNFPQTYKSLLAAQIKEDFTLGYPDQIGFRAGICIPYKWYDLDKEETSDLTIRPFQIMDVTLKNYLKLDPALAIQKCKQIINETFKYQGEFIFIWHNSSVKREWEPWIKVYKSMVELGQKLMQD